MEINFSLDSAFPISDVAPALIQKNGIVYPEARSIFTTNSSQIPGAIFTHMNNLLRKYSQENPTLRWKGLSLTHFKRISDPVKAPTLPWEAASLSECLKEIDYQTFQKKQKFYLVAACDVLKEDSADPVEGRVSWNLKITALRMYDEIGEDDED